MQITTIRQEIIEAFESEFEFIKDKFELIELLENNSPMDYKTIKYLKLPSEDNNIVWHPGVYVFIGNNQLYRVGVSMRNSRSRVMEHLIAKTSKNRHCIWDIDKFSDKSTLLFNVKYNSDRYFLLAIAAFFETKFQPKIKAGRIG